MALMSSSQPLLPSYKAILNKFYRANITQASKFDNFSGKLSFTDYMEHTPFEKDSQLIKKNLCFSKNEKEHCLL
jgi:hypothetical protein